MIDIQHIVWEIGEAAQRLTQLGALEGAAGNISVFIVGSEVSRQELPTWLDESVPWSLPDGAALPTGVLLITGTGRRLRDVARDPRSTLCAIVVGGEGTTHLRRSGASDVRPTSEIDSHVGIHAATAATPGQPHAVIHAQPPYLTWLSHIPAYRDFARLNRQLLRWQPETVVMLAEGIGIVPFVTPGTPEQGRLTTEELRTRRLLVWAKHGVVARSTAGPLAAADLIDYAEAAARYEVLDIQSGRPADGMTLAELRAVAARFSVMSTVLGDLPDGLLRQDQ